MANCVTCRSELKFLQELGLQVHGSYDLEGSAQRGLSQVLSRIDRADSGGDGSAGRPSRETRSSRLQWLKRQLGGSPFAVQRALAVQAVLIVALVGLLVATYQTKARPVFQTLSDTPVAITISTPQIRVLFAEQATEKQIRSLLEEVEAQIVAGPSPLGVYTLSIHTQEQYMDATDDLIDYLKQSDIVRFADLASDQISGETP